MFYQEGIAAGSYTGIMSGQSGPGRVIAITSGKGGVGKTQTTVNLAIALTRLGRKVLILDADLGLANVNVMLGFEPQAHLGKVLTGEAKLRDIIVHHSTGIDIIPASSGVVEMTNLSEDEQNNLVAAFEDLADDYDYLLVDTAAGIGDNVLYFNEAAEDIIVVVDSEPTSITDAYALIKVLVNKSQVKTFHVLTNRIPQGTEGKSIFAKLAAPTDKFLNVSLKFLGSVQEDSGVPQAIKSQKPFLELFPSSKAGMDLTRIAKKIAEWDRPRSPKGGMQFFFRSLVQPS